MPQIVTEAVAGISQLKANPMETVAQGNGDAVAILNRNTPAFYCVPAELYVEMIEIIEDTHWNRIADSRRDEKEIEVSLDQL